MTPSHRTTRPASSPRLLLAVSLLAAFCVTTPSGARAGDDAETTSSSSPPEAAVSLPKSDRTIWIEDGDMDCDDDRTTPSRLLVVSDGESTHHDLDDDCGQRLFSVGDVYSGRRELVVIGGRYRFYLYNAHRDAIAGPFEPTFHGIGQDSQSGMLAGMQFFEEGAFVAGYQVDSGIFLYSLRHALEPVELDAVASARTAEGEASLFLMPIPARTASDDADDDGDTAADDAPLSGRYKVIWIATENWSLTGFEELHADVRLAVDGGEPIVTVSDEGRRVELSAVDGDAPGDERSLRFDLAAPLGRSE